MDRKTEIILAALELASENGLGTVSMNQIAEKIGISKPALYKHFESREEIVKALYSFLREKSKQNMASSAVNLEELLQKKISFKNPYNNGGFLQKNLYRA